MSKVFRFVRQQAIAMCALCVALGGTSYAAMKIDGGDIKNGSVAGADLKNGSVTGADIKDGSLAAADLSKKALRRGPQGPAGPAGPQGPAGAAGPKGPQGPSGAGFSAFHDPEVALPDAPGAIGKLDIPAPGAYVVIAKATMVHNGVPTNADCSLVAADGNNVDSDRQIAGVFGFASLTTTVVHAFAQAGAATLFCTDNGGEIAAGSIKITAIPLGSLTNKPF